MIRRPNNWDQVQEFSDRPKLPLGANISDGEFKGFFEDEFKANSQANKKWKGVLRVWIPRDDGSDKDEWTKSSFKGMVTSFEKSNAGYQWNWDENSLAGKYVGILFRNEEWEYEGKTGWAVRPFRAISVDSVRSGDFKLPKDKPLKNKTVASDYGFDSTAYGYGNQTSSFAVMDDDGDCPF